MNNNNLTEEKILNARYKDAIKGVEKFTNNDADTVLDLLGIAEGKVSDMFCELSKIETEAEAEANYQPLFDNVLQLGTVIRVLKEKVDPNVLTNISDLVYHIKKQELANN